MLDIVRSMYESVWFKVKSNNKLSEDILWGHLSILGVRQEGSLFPFLFPMYLNDIEYYFMLNGSDEKDLGILKCSFCCILLILLGFNEVW